MKTRMHNGSRLLSLLLAAAGLIVMEQNLSQTMLDMAYANAYSDSLTYTDQEIQEAYDADPKTFDRVSWEYVLVSGTADSTTDAEGNTVAPTDEETAAAKEAAKELGERLGRGCRIVTGRKKGRIELEYYGLDDLNGLLDALAALRVEKKP